MKFQNKGAVLVQIAPLLFSQPAIKISLLLHISAAHADDREGTAPAHES